MNQYEEKQIDSPLARSIFYLQFGRDQHFEVSARSSPRILVKKYRSEVQLEIVGSHSQANSYYYAAGTELIGVRLGIGAFLSQFPPRALLNSTTRLPQTTAQSFWLNDIMLPLPDFETIDVFVERLERHRLIARNKVVQEALHERPHPKFLRSVQRHF